MKKQLIECVPNISEGRDESIIQQVADIVGTVEGVSLLDVDAGKDTNRTVITFVGEPAQVCKAAFLVVKKASELIDMSKHKGKHPRFGATDVCPLIPVSNITMEETVEYAHQLAKRIGDELSIPVYCYEHAARDTKRKNLATCRAGEYEGLKDKLAKPEWAPDFGPAEFNARSGATAVSARDFLVAYNINLNTKSTRRANAIAFDVRERGRVKREGNGITGKIVKDEAGNPIHIPGSLKCVKGIGWFIEEYNVAQISMNLTNISVTPMHIAFDEVCKRSLDRGVRVTGSELVGLLPLQAMLDAGRFFLKKQERSLGVSDAELIHIAVKSMGLDELAPFNPKEKIIEYAIEEESTNKLVDLSLCDFCDETSSESPAPGGGSIAASMGAMGVALGTMVANLSAHKRGWDDRWEEFSEWAVQGREIQDELIFLVDEDTRSFNRIMDAFSLPKGTDQEKHARTLVIQEATKYAIQIPFRVMKSSFKAFEILEAMVQFGNPNSVSDAGVGALAVRSCVLGAHMNVKINAKELDDQEFVEKILKEAQEIETRTIVLEQRILEIVHSKF